MYKILGQQRRNEQQWIHVITQLLSQFVDSCQMCAYAKWVGGKREKKRCVSYCLWRCLTLQAKISASSNVPGRASDFTTYSLFVSHANRPERDRILRQQTESHSLSCLLLLRKGGINYSTQYGVSMDTILSQSITGGNNYLFSVWAKLFF